MSLINRMLQDLDARGSDGGRYGTVHAEVRAVGSTRESRVGWWVALICAVLLGGAGSWIWLSTAGAFKTAPNVAGNMAPEIKAAPASAVHTDQQDALPVATVEEAAEVPVALTPDPGPNAAGSPDGRIALADSLAPLPAPTPVDVPAQPAVPIASATSAKSVPADVPRVEKQEATQAPAPVPVPASSETIPYTPIVKQVKELTAQQRAENDYRRAITLVTQSKVPDAIVLLQQALAKDSLHTAARQTLAGLLLDAGRRDDAISVLQEGVAADSRQVGLVMILARLQLEKADVKSAVASLQNSLPHAEERSDYHAFLAALLQRELRHKEAVEHYSIALRRAPQNAVWWMGLGISLQAEQRLADARNAFGRARAANTLTPELQAFVEQKLDQLPR